MRRGDKRRHEAKADTAAKCNVKVCKAEAGTAAQSWETNPKDCKETRRETKGDRRQTRRTQ